MEKLAQQQTQKPFNCELLAVTGEDVIDHNEERVPKGSMICYPKIGSERSYFCGVDRSSFVPSGEHFKVKCSWNHSLFEIKIVGFKSRKR